MIRTPVNIQGSTSDAKACRCAKPRKSIDGIETSQKKRLLSAYQLTHKINNH